MHTNSAQRSVDSFDNIPLYKSQFEFMSMTERLQRINDRIKKFGTKSPVERNEPVERCTMLRFTVDAKSVTEARHLVIALCKDRMIFMRIKPVQNSAMMQMEMFLRESIVQRVNELLKLRFRV